MAENKIVYLELDRIGDLCYEIAKYIFETDDCPMPYFRYINKNIMESALESAKMPYYKTIFDKAGTIGYQIIAGHPLIDGNKRIGITATLVFLRLNGYIVQTTQEDLLSVALNLARKKIGRQEFVQWLEKHSKQKEDL